MRKRLLSSMFVLSLLTGGTAACGGGVKVGSTTTTAAVFDPGDNNNNTTTTATAATTTSPTDDDSTFNETARDRFGVAGGAVMESEFTTGDDLTSEETARAICEGEDVFLLLVPGADEADSQGFFDFAMEEFCPSERE